MKLKKGEYEYSHIIYTQNFIFINKKIPETIVA